MIEPTTQAVLMGQLRTLLATVGGALVAKGVISAGNLELALGIVMALIPFLWSALGKYNDERKVRERELVAVNAGIKLADNTVGPTPLVPPAAVPVVIANFAPSPAVIEALNQTELKP